MTRLSDEELSSLYWNGLANDGQVEKWLDLERSLSIIHELRQSRAAALTEEERETLDGLRLFLRSRFGASHIGQEQIAVLDRLLATTKGEP